MRRYTSHAAQTDTGVDINISPLIDIVFLLLIFFIVTAVFVGDSGVNINRPAAAVAVPADRQAIRIAIRDDGRIFCDRREISLHSVRAIVAHRLSIKPGPVVIEADAESRTRRFVDVHDECKLAGAEHVYVATREETEP